MSEASFDYFYRLDSHDRIVEWGGPQWAVFAKDNGGDALAVANLVGDRIYDHVAGHFTRRFLFNFFASVRASGAPQVRTYRCDSPATKRLMQMRALPEGAAGLRVEHRIVAQTPAVVEVDCRESVVARRAGHFRCSICGRLRARGTAHWREADDGVVKAGTLMVVHTVCPQCRSGVAARLPETASVWIAAG